LFANLDYLILSVDLHATCTFCELRHMKLSLLQLIKKHYHELTTEDTM